MVHYYWDGNRNMMHLECPVGMAMVLEASFDLCRKVV